MYFDASQLTDNLLTGRKFTEALEGHFSYYLQLICYSLIVITYLLMLTWFHIDMPNSDCDILVTTYNLFVIA